MEWFVRDTCLFLLILASVVRGQDEEKEPTVEVLTKTFVFNVGDQKAIYCKGTNLKERLEWFSPTSDIVKGRSTKNKRIIVERSKAESLENCLVPLIIQHAEINDTGKWTCKSGDVNETIDILVGERVVFTSLNDTMEADEGKTAKIHCEAKGYPEPRVDWYKDTVPITEDRKYSMTRRGNNYALEIRNLNHLDSGEYLCKVTQEELSYYAGKVTSLSVQHKPMFFDPVNQQVTEQRWRTEEVYAILEETKNITCTVLANPAPSYYWFRGKKPQSREIPPEPDMIFNAEDGTYSVLMLRIYNTSFLGEYTCTANNSRGVVSVLYHVTVGNKPEIPDFVNVVNSSVDTIVFNVTCSKCNIVDPSEVVAPDPENLPLLGYSFQLTPVNEEYVVPDWDLAVELRVEIAEANNTIFSVGPLANSTIYHARVRAMNAAGFSDWLEVPDTVATTDFAIQFVASAFIVIATLLFSFINKI